VHAEVDWAKDFTSINDRFFVVQSQASSKVEYLKRPDLGRLFDEESRERIGDLGTRNAVLQVVIGDGLSARAVQIQAQGMLKSLAEGAAHRDWKFGTPFGVRFCRVGILNDIGAILNPSVVVLLIGERPGLATAESLSAYLAFRPKHGDTDANRNLISNIHSRGVPLDQAAPRVLALVESLLKNRTSGVAVKEELPEDISQIPSRFDRFPTLADAE
jgi:ethanolamine ammonia-lyase small subunit